MTTYSGKEVKSFRKGDVVKGLRSGNLYKVVRKCTQKLTYDNYKTYWLVENLATGEQKYLYDTYLVLDGTEKGSK